MIIDKNSFLRKESIVECDMCKTKMNGCDRISIKVGLGSDNAKKKWDLCKKCYKKVERAVDNCHKRKGEKNDT